MSEIIQKYNKVILYVIFVAFNEIFMNTEISKDLYFVISARKISKVSDFCAH